jgi:hypothetical protein
MERLERVIVKDYQTEARSHRDKLLQNHRVRKRIDEMQGIASKLVRQAIRRAVQWRQGRVELCAAAAWCWCRCAATRAASMPHHATLITHRH